MQQQLIFRAFLFTVLLALASGARQPAIARAPIEGSDASRGRTLAIFSIPAEVLVIGVQCIPDTLGAGQSTTCTAFITTLDRSPAQAPVSWDFGDGTSVGNQLVVTHAFSSSGTYTVSVTMYDSGYPTTAATRISVQPAPAPSGRPPAAPSNLRATAVDSTRIRLDWINNTNNADGIDIYDASTHMSVRKVPGNATSYTLVNLIPGSVYCAYLYAFNSAGYSDPSNQVCGTTTSVAAPAPSRAPLAPTNLRATDIDSTRIRLDWASGAENVDSFAIFSVDVATGAYAQVASAASGARSYTIGGLTPASHYCFYLAAYNRAGYSGPSNEDCADTP